MLTLPIKKKWFEMIRNGVKLEEYREIKPYYKKRFEKLWQGSLIGGDAEREIMFRNGYRSDSPSLIAGCKLRIGEGRPEWGAEEGKNYYILDIQSVAERRGQNEVRRN